MLIIYVLPNDNPYGIVLQLPPEWTVHCAACAFIAVGWLFGAAFTGAFAFARPQNADGDNGHRKDNQQYDDRSKIHAMIALAMR
jgi:hypothetical protein